MESLEENAEAVSALMQCILALLCIYIGIVLYVSIRWFIGIRLATHRKPPVLPDRSIDIQT